MITPSVIFTLAACMSSATGQGVQVPRWQPHDFSFQSQTEYENPFLITFSATVTEPDGKEFTTLGFYDGEGTWKIRLAPKAEGEWSLRTHSDDSALDGKTVSFICVANDNPNVHGGLQIDADHRYHFVFEDGTRYFLSGYEFDWLWALDTDQPDLPKLKPLLDKLAAHGFNHIILNAYAHDCKWREGKTEEYDYGPPPMYAWHGTNDQPDHSRFNLAYWQHYDRMMNELYQRGIIAHIMIKVYNKMVNWPATGSAEDDLYFRWIISRYAAYPNVVWDFSKEANNEKNLDYKLNRFQFIRESDPYSRLITNHDDKKTYDTGAYNDVLDFRSDQHHRNWRETILRQRQQNKWPAVNVEFGYEHGPGGLEDKTYRVVQPPEEVCRRAWEICLAGGYIAYYYTYTAWDVIHPEDTPPGYAYFKHLYDFFEGTRYWLMQPTDGLISEGYCLANPGNEYVVFLNEAKPFTLKLEGKEFKAVWYHPFTGERMEAGSLAQGSVSLTPPVVWGQGPVALHVQIRE